MASVKKPARGNPAKKTSNKATSKSSQAKPVAHAKPAHATTPAHAKRAAVKPSADHLVASKPTAVLPKEQTPDIRLSIIIEHDGKILVGKRKSAHGAGVWEIQGGQLLFGETFEAGVFREIKEQVGLENVIMGGIISISNEVSNNTHSVSIGFHVVLLNGEPLIQEPAKVERLMWVDPRYLPEPMFEPSQHTVENWVSGIMYRPKDSLSQS